MSAVSQEQTRPTESCQNEDGIIALLYTCRCTESLRWRRAIGAPARQWCVLNSFYAPVHRVMSGAKQPRTGSTPSAFRGRLLLVVALTTLTTHLRVVAVGPFEDCEHAGDWCSLDACCGGGYCYDPPYPDTWYARLSSLTASTSIILMLPRLVYGMSLRAAWLAHVDNFLAEIARHQQYQDMAVAKPLFPEVCTSRTILLPELATPRATIYFTTHRYGRHIRASSKLRMVALQLHMRLVYYRLTPTRPHTPFRTTKKSTTAAAHAGATTTPA